MKNGFVRGACFLLAGLPAWAEVPLAGGTFEDLATALASPAEVRVLEIKQGDPNVGRIAELSECVNLEKLVLHRCNLSEFPDLSKLPRLTYLDLSFNAFDHVPETVTKLSGLQSFAMFGNRLSELPNGIEGLKELRYLFLGQNPDLNIEDAIVKLKPLDKLENLGFGGIAISSLPAAIGELKSLKLLWLANTGLHTLPETISRLDNLETLVLTGCKFERLPEVVERLPRLQSVVLKGNPVSEEEIDRIKARFPDLQIRR